MLTLGFDAKRALYNASGLGNYSRTLLSNLLTYFPEHAYHGFAPSQNKREPLSASTPLVHHPSMHLHLDSRPWANLSRSLGLRNQLRRTGVQLYHGLSNEIPLDLRGSGITTVMTVHDLLFLDYPQTYPWIDRQIYRLKTQAGLSRADRIVAISQTTRDRMVHHFPTLQNRIQVIYQPCSTCYYRDPWTDPENRDGLPNHPYWLYVGTIETRKNLLGLLQALSSLPKQDRLPLVVIGRGGHYARVCREFGARHGLDLRWIPNHRGDLRAWYQGATALLYPSLSEGFGLPVAEALLSGCQVLTSEKTSMAEFSEDWSIIVDPKSISSMAEGLRISLKPYPHERRVQARSAMLQNLDPFKITGQWLSLYQEIA
ncbi:MAG: glycosyltransferase family 4 protein [Bacteroidia bacterium]